MTTPTQNPNEGKPLTPDSLASQLFDMAMAQTTDPKAAAKQTVDFLSASLFYAVTVSKNDIVVFLTETLIYIISAGSADEKSRKEMLKQVGEIITMADLPPGLPNRAAAPPAK